MSWTTINVENLVFPLCKNGVSYDLYGYLNLSSPFSIYNLNSNTETLRNKFVYVQTLLFSKQGRVGVSRKKKSFTFTVCVTKTLVFEVK